MTNQKGVTVVGMIMIAAMIIFVAIIGIRMVPAYIEYATIVNHLREIARSPEARGASVRDIQTMFSKRAQIDDIKSVDARDIDVEKEGESVILRTTYSSRVPLMGNVSACIDFQASSE
ncbi:MAG: DUF4845 domain-containing protein [Burkholderiales bacterium]